jgi:NAD(P)-dependent dehydrogenase (short-subunit alcohol dehydrogenase family)
MTDKTNNSVLITGGTGSVGSQLVKKFASTGYEVTFIYFKNEILAKELATSFKATPIMVNLVSDFSLPSTEYSIIINNAGVNISNVITHETTIEDWNETIQINLTAAFRIIKTCLPNMIRNNWGRIINISSIYGLRGVDYNVPYNVSKHGLSGLTKSIAKEYGPFNITCNEICPGPIVSEMMTRIGKQESASLGISVEEYFKQISDSIPCKRMACPEDIASLALFLASPDAEYINGVSIPLDGGLLC